MHSTGGGALGGGHMEIGQIRLHNQPYIFPSWKEQKQKILLMSPCAKNTYLFVETRSKKTPKTITEKLSSFGDPWIKRGIMLVGQVI